MTLIVKASINANAEPFISALAGTGVNAYFADQYNQPRFMLLEQCWALPANGGRWGAGTFTAFQSDVNAYFSNRSAQGYTAWYGLAWGDGSIDSSMLGGGRRFDGTYALTVNGTPGAISTGTETIGLNNTFWTWIDYLFATAKSYGITCFLNLAESYDFSTTNGVAGIWTNATNTQFHAFGAAIATRYPLSAYPNVFFFWGDDGQGNQDTPYSQMLSGMQSAGDTRGLISTEYYGETNSHIEFDTGALYPGSGSFGLVNATYNWVYTYNPCYLGVEDSYTESGTTQIPVVWGDGPYYGDTDNSTADYTERRNTWWALASGARGLNNTSGPSGNQSAGEVWAWQSGAVAALTTDPNGSWITGHIKNVISYFTLLPDWYKLIPDTGNVFVTAGRGTRGTSPPPGFTHNYGDTDNYVCASITAAGTLAVIYCGQHFSITVDQTKMQAGYTAAWVDPSSLAVTATTTGSTYNSTGLGNNSAGNPDWVLILKGP